ncbi:hypothetical protein X777_10675 [Ooceraea biroi]|uniref:Uncharacterized protein n=1 Tax=Ooceraea biroi TaxID=2015173 RepID=A0A026W333_OOCBI|nr:hypothetical protein X777_10675 [Ooceraea biroi]
MDTNRRNGRAPPRFRIRISIRRDSNGWLPPVARHGGLQSPRRLHHRYLETEQKRGTSRAINEEEDEEKNDEEERSNRGRKRKKFHTARSFAEVGERRWREEKKVFICGLPLRSGANGGLKSYAIERRRSPPHPRARRSRRKSASSRRDQPVDPTAIAERAIMAERIAFAIAVCPFERSTGPS